MIVAAVVAATVVVVAATVVVDAVVVAATETLVEVTSSITLVANVANRGLAIGDGVPSPVGSSM